jgi:hypothetical protein
MRTMRPIEEACKCAESEPAHLSVPAILGGSVRFGRAVHYSDDFSSEPIVCCRRMASAS